MKSFSISIPSIERWSFIRDLKQLKFLNYNFEWLEDWGFITCDFLIKGKDEHINYIYKWIGAAW